MSGKDRPELYEVISDPAKRLAHEGAFLRRLLETAPGKRVLDAACGTGAHAEFLAEHGASVVARDVDADALEYARARHAHKGITWERGDMREASGGPFDLAVIIGNSLSLLPSRADVRRTLAAVREELAPRGIAFLHVINYHSLEAGAPRHKVARKTLADGEAVVVKNMIPTGRGGGVLVAFGYFVRKGDKWEAWGSESTLLNLSREFFLEAVGAAGFAIEGEYGDYDMSAWDPERSPDLLIVARKP